MLKINWKFREGDVVVTGNGEDIVLLAGEGLRGKVDWEGQDDLKLMLDMNGAFNQSQVVRTASR